MSLENQLQIVLVLIFIWGQERAEARHVHSQQPPSSDWRAESRVERQRFLLLLLKEEEEEEKKEEEEEETTSSGGEAAAFSPRVRAASHSGT